MTNDAPDRDTRTQKEAAAEEAALVNTELLERLFAVLNSGPAARMPRRTAATLGEVLLVVMRALADTDPEDLIFDLGLLDQLRQRLLIAIGVATTDARPAH